MALCLFYEVRLNGGTSTALLQSDLNYRERSMQTMLWAAALDDRYGAGQITSRIGLLAEAHKFDPDSALWAAVQAEHRQRPLACVLVDEAPFLSRTQVLALARLAHAPNIPVLCYGLRTDFAAHLFPGSAALPALAHALVQRTAAWEGSSKPPLSLPVA